MVADFEKPALLEVDRLEVVYNRIALAVQGVSMTVREGSIISLLGINGSGKTTTLRAIAGFLSVDNAEISKGNVRFKGEEIGGKTPQAIASRGISLIPERNKVFSTLSVEENLAASGAAAGKEKQYLEIAFEYFPVLKERRKQVAGYLSGGERQMLAMSLGLAGSPELLMVDELSLGLAPFIVKNLSQTLKQLNDERGIAIFLVEQSAAVGLGICDYGYVLESGRIVYEGSRERLLESEDIQEFYLGKVDERAKSYREVKQYRRVRRWWA